MSSAALLLAPLVLTLAIMPAVIARLSKMGVVDLPSHRSLHNIPVPRGGGIAPAAAVLVLVGAGFGAFGGLRWALIVAAGGLALLGFADDLHSLSPVTRLMWQAAIALAAGLLVYGSFSAGAALFAVFGALWIVAYVNAFNFMDGINGISAAQAIVAGIVWTVGGLAAGSTPLAAGGLVVAGAALGLLPFNFPNARVFLGDSGSYFFGAWLAVMALVALRSGLTPETVFAPLGLYLADTGSTLLRRVRRGEPFLSPHREHVFQKLVAAGWSHSRTTLTAAAFMLGCSALGAFSNMGPGPRMAADAGLAGLLLIYLRLPELLYRRSMEGVRARA